MILILIQSKYKKPDLPLSIKLVQLMEVLSNPRGIKEQIIPLPEGASRSMGTADLENGHTPSCFQAKISTYLFRRKLSLYIIPEKEENLYRGLKHYLLDSSQESWHLPPD
jgi:hypothetical protein